MPDILICAKGLTSGYIPLSATLFRDELWDVMSSPKGGESVFAHGFTYSGHPVACAAALANIGIMEREDTCAHVKTVGALFERELAQLSDCPLVGDVRGRHLMLALELVADKDTKQSFALSVGADKRIEAECKKRGLIVRPHRNPGDLIVLSPPLAMTEADAKWVAAVLRESIEAAIAPIIEEQPVHV
ncbi:MAG: aminotransferase class III-fold pyridoxal phosphate-dependent enzyme [Actinomycetia bacterium]|nr:aminotransferase class III-fold pyridoxal phosphate-dependent enzyme [Actinomycetes bacterium]